MLVLTRKERETIVIDHNIRVTVVQILGDKVRLGIEAPAEIEVHREEVERAIQKELAQLPRAEEQK